MGGTSSQLSQEQIDQLIDVTPFTEKEIHLILKRYAIYDSSEGGRDGIPVKAVATIPEFSSQPLMARVAKLYADDETGNVHHQKFLYLCGVLCSRTPTRVKRQLAFRCLDIHRLSILKYDEVFGLYKLLFDRVLTDDQILRLAHNALSHPGLRQQGQIVEEEFEWLIPDKEIEHRLTADLQLPS